MAEEDIAPSTSPVPSDHKRKLEDLEAEAPNRDTSSPPSTEALETNGKPDGVLEAVEVEEDETRRSDVQEVKRPRLEEESADDAEPSLEDQRTEAPSGEGAQPVSTGIAQEAEEGLVSTTVNVHPGGDDELPPAAVRNVNPDGGDELPLAAVRNVHPDGGDELPPAAVRNVHPDGGDELPPAAVRNVHHPDASVLSTEQPQDLTQPTSRKIEVPNNKVGVLIGKAGDTIRLLQYNSGAKIQITRDAEADPYAASRPVELIGSLESITKAEQLIKDVIAEADAGGSPSLVARGFGTAQTGSEQVQIQVPNEKVGLIIGKGGETIKNLQTRSGARIQLIPQHLPDGDQSKERTVRVTGNKKQIDIAREMIKEVMSQTPLKPSPLSGGYPQQAFRPRGPPGLPQWGPSRGPPPSAQPTNYDYQQRGMYPQHVGQHPPPAYGGYPQQPAPRTGYSPGWEQRPPAQTQVPPPQSGGYDYYGQGGAPPASVPAPGPTQAHSNYNYGQTQGSDYGQPHGYSQSVPPQQAYENHTPIQHPYGASQQGYSLPAGAPSGYTQPYGRPPYGMPPAQGPPPQSYGPPRATQPGDMQQYQGPPMSTAPSYASTGPPAQQSYPYGANGSAQQPYPYGPTAGTNDGYTQAGSIPAPGYGQQGGPTSYGQPTGGAGQTGYAQGGQAGGYVQYPSGQQGYGEQQTPGNPNYGGYQGSTDAGYASGAGSAYGVPPGGQQGYVQPPSNPPTYDQSMAQAGYGTHAGAAQVGYTKSLSPQPGYAQYAGTTATAGTAPDGQLYAQGHH
ncbi:glutenin, high molecular weight subunit 12-like [Aristolochia californica]|uniref:glutenin, high molecular weight subunit 12-like n=1 Tax=Aristolochia californica TaxID=171875 RepID=UPI0035D9ED55